MENTTNNLNATKDVSINGNASSTTDIPTTPCSANKFAGASIVDVMSAKDPAFVAKLDASAIEDVVELKISRFFDQVGSFFPENVHELIMSKVEKPLIIQVLRRVGGNRIKASKILGINRNTLRKRMKIYGI